MLADDRQILDVWGEISVDILGDVTDKTIMEKLYSWVLAD